MNDDTSTNIQKFLEDSLATHGSQEALRKANFLANKKQGRNAGYGFALGDLLRVQGPTLGYIAPTPKPLGGKNSSNTLPGKSDATVSGGITMSETVIDGDVVCSDHFYSIKTACYSLRFSPVIYRWFSRATR